MKSHAARLLPLCLLVLTAIAPLPAAPVITAVMNAASNIDPRMPNAAIAPGSIFIVKGTGLGPAKLSIAQNPFQSTTLNGTSVQLTVAGKTVDALMYYTSANQVAALLPSPTPTGGPGTITVTYNGQTSAATAFRGVAAHNLALFTVDSTGTGPAIVTYPDGSLVSDARAATCGGPYTTCGAANPGDTLILWGTGLGAVNGDEASGTGLGQNMPDLPLTLWLGGVKASVTYQGRSGCCVGEDQVVFTVPDNVPTSCGMPLVVQINNQISNSTVLPIASRGSRTCAEPSNGLSEADVQRLSSVSSFNLGTAELDHFGNETGGGYHDQSQFIFAKISGIPAADQPFLASLFANPPVGTCTVFNTRPPSDVFFNRLTFAPLDAGSSFTIAGPQGAMTVKANLGDKPVLSQSGTFLTPGDYTITGGPGKDVGAFTAHVTLPAAPVLISPAPPAASLTVNRNQGLTVTWNPNGSTGHVEIVLASSVDQNTNNTALCVAPASAGTFTIPAYVLLTLPAGSNTVFAFRPGDETPAVSAPFTATGLDIGLIQVFVDGTQFEGFRLQ